MKQKQEGWHQGNVRFEDISVGTYFLNVNSNRLSLVTALTSNSVEMYNKADVAHSMKMFKKNKGKSSNDWDEEDDGKFRVQGKSTRNWYAMDQFNRTFKQVDYWQHYFDQARKWVNMFIDSYRLNTDGVLVRKQIIEFEDFI